MKETIKNLKNRYLIFKCRLMVAILAGFLGGLSCRRRQRHGGYQRGDINGNLVF